MKDFLDSTFGFFLVQLFGGLMTAPSQENLYWLAYGWSMARGRFFVSTFIGLSGAATKKHFSRFYVFLGAAFYKALEKFWIAIILQAAKRVPEGEPIRLKVDDRTQKRTGKKIQGASHYRNSAGTARQEYRVLWGINLVYAVMSVPIPFLEGRFLSVPVGLKFYLKEEDAKHLEEDYKRRSELARQIVDLVAKTLPERKILVSGDGGYATQYFLRGLPENVEVVSRLPVTASLLECQPATRKGRRGRKPAKGQPMGTPRSLAQKRDGWKKHPNEAGAEIQSWVGIWHGVLPGRPIRFVVVRRPALPKNSRRPPVEAFFSTDLTLSEGEILGEFKGRWDIEIDIRDGNEFYGIGKNRCRKYARIVGANSFCAIMAAARTLWFLENWDRCQFMKAQRFRPWYPQKEKPSQHDIAWALVEALNAQGISAVPTFLDPRRKNAKVA